MPETRGGTTEVNGTTESILPGKTNLQGVRNRSQWQRDIKS